MRTITPQEINRMLGDKALELCEMLLPNGKKNGTSWQCGSVQGESGSSLSVDLQTGKGFNDFADSDAKGSYIDLWMQTSNLSFVDAFTEAKQWLGVYEQEPVKQFKKPSKAIAKKAVETKIEKYLTERKITLETINQFGVTQDRVSVPDGQKGWYEVDAIRFEYIQDGEVQHVKFKYFCKVDKKFKWWATSGTKRILFGWHLIPESFVESVVITEGEFDAMVYHQMGFHALSVPNGGGDEGKQDWIIYDYENLSRFNTIYISMDMDAVGVSTIKTLVDRLGIERCKIVSLPHKDANDCLKNGATKQDFEKYIADAKYSNIKEVKQVSDYSSEVIEFMYDDQGMLGFETPWENINEVWRLRLNELTLINGINNHGKSEFANQFIIHSALKLNIPSFIASMEHSPKKLIRNLIKQAVGTASIPAKALALETIRRCEDKILIGEFDHTLKPQKLIEVIIYSHRRFGVNVVLIDSLMKCGIAPDDYAKQKDFVNELFSLTRKFDLHIILIVHPRKSDNEDKIPNKMDVAGAGDLTNITDNLFTVWRNKNREEAVKRQQKRADNDPDFYDKLNQAMAASNPNKDQLLIKRDQEKIDSAAPVVIALQKDREGGNEQKFAMSYKKSQHIPTNTPHNRHYITLLKGVA